MSLQDLPPEILIQTLAFSLQENRSRCHVLLINKYLNTLATELLHSDLYLPSIRAISLFAQQGPIKLPRTVTVELPGGEVGRGAFQEMNLLLARLVSYSVDMGMSQPVQHAYQLPLDDLRLCMHSTANPKVDDVHLHALGLVNPRSFTWTGPDPAHHFSTAIVPTALSSLVAHLALWTNLRHLHVSNISFPSALSRVSYSRDMPALFPALPHLRTVYIGQATMMPLLPLAKFIIWHAYPDTIDDDALGGDALQEVKLVDCYSESIWGPRVRRGDVEQAAISLAEKGAMDVLPVGSRRGVGDHLPQLESQGDDAAQHTNSSGEIRALRAVWTRLAVNRVRAIVRCEALTERIIGGDRVEGSVRVLE